MNEKAISLRIAEIVYQLAEQKRAFFADGLEQPMSVRATLEAELASLRLEKLKIREAQNTRNLQVRQLRGALLKQRLDELGLLDLLDQCSAQAEDQIPQLN